MARRSSATARLLVGLSVGIALYNLSALVFVSPPAPRVQQATVGATAAVAGATVLFPEPSAAAELTFDGWGPPEITAVVVPIVFVTALYLEWFSKQQYTDEDVTGAGVLGKQVDGVGRGTYFRRSEETG